MIQTESSKSYTDREVGRVSGLSLLSNSNDDFSTWNSKDAPASHAARALWGGSFTFIKARAGGAVIITRPQPSPS